MCRREKNKWMSLQLHVVLFQGAAAEDGRLKRGDQIIAVNGQSLEGVTHEEAVAILKRTKGTVTLTVLSWTGTPKVWCQQDYIILIPHTKENRSVYITFLLFQLVRTVLHHWRKITFNDIFVCSRSITHIVEQLWWSKSSVAKTWIFCLVAL